VKWGLLQEPIELWLFSKLGGFFLLYLVALVGRSLFRFVLLGCLLGLRKLLVTVVLVGLFELLALVFRILLGLGLSVVSVSHFPALSVLLNSKVAPTWTAVWSWRF